MYPISTPLHPKARRLQVRASWGRSWKLAARIVIPIVAVSFAWSWYASVRVAGLPRRPER